jgi:hypothetical protein
VGEPGEGLMRKGLFWMGGGSVEGEALVGGNTVTGVA